MALRVRNLFEAWKRIAHKIGDFQARLILIVFYFFVIGPFALLIRWRGDPLGIKPDAARGWLAKNSREDTPMERAIEQF
jgi:hypothetical protein